MISLEPLPPYDVTYTGTSEYHWSEVGSLVNAGYGNRGYVDEDGSPVKPYDETAGPFGFDAAMQHEPDTVRYQY